MVRVSHELDEELRAIEYPFSALASGVSSPECSMGIIKVEIRDCLPYAMHFIWWKRDL
jgi:hypothetical protein